MNSTTNFTIALGKHIVINRAIPRQDLPERFLQRPDGNYFRLCMSYGHCCNDPTLPSQYKVSHRQCVNIWVWLLQKNYLQKMVVDQIWLTGCGLPAAVQNWWPLSTPTVIANDPQLLHDFLYSWHWPLVSKMTTTIYSSLESIKEKLFI